MSSGQPSNPIKSETRAKLDVYLSEMQFVNNQMHIRMQGIYQFIAQGILLFTVLLGAIIVNLETMITNKIIYPLLFISIPFCFLVLLKIREDRLMASHDHYFHEVIRKEILDILNEKDNSATLSFLQYIAPLKIGGIFTLLSALRYIFPLFSIATSLIFFVTLKYFNNLEWEAYEHWLFVFNLMVCIFIFAIGYMSGKPYSKKNYPNL